jgi:hypothetical protein
MFTPATLKNIAAPRTVLTTTVTSAPATIPTTVTSAPTTTVTSAPTTTVTSAPTTTVTSAPTVFKKNNAKPFTPFQKDKLFWCFYIILNGYEEYEMNHSNSFSIEKQIKIETVEKLKAIKDQLKALKLKRTELEDELVHKPNITLKGLCALCLVHNVSITYIYGRKYCEITTTDPAKKGIIVQNAKKEDSLKCANEDAAFLNKLREEYWLIDITQIQKPLKAPSAYTLSDLQDICKKLQLETHLQVNEKAKAKPKNKLYEEILQCL